MSSTPPPWAEWFAKWEGWPKVRWLPTQKRKRNGEYEHVPMSYSCRLGRRRQGDYLAARRRRLRQAWFDRWFARLDALEEEDATGNTTAGTKASPVVRRERGSDSRKTAAHPATVGNRGARGQRAQRKSDR